MAQYIGHLGRFDIRTAADPKVHRLARGQYSTQFRICPGNPACFNGVAGFRLCQNLQIQALVIQEAFRLGFIQIHQIFHGLHQRFRTTTDRNIDFGTYHHFLVFKHRELLHDHAAFVLIAVGPILQHDLEIRQILHIFIILTHQVWQGHIVRLAAKSAVEHGHQEDHNGDHRHHRTSHNSNGSNIAAVLLRLRLATALRLVIGSAGRLFTASRLLPTNRSRMTLPTARHSLRSGFGGLVFVLSLRYRRQHP